MTVAPPGPSLRDRKKAASRQALQDAAVRLAAERGYAHLTVDAVAAEAGVSTRTFFNYFSSKEEALFSPNPEAHQRIATEILEAPADHEPLRVLRDVCIRSAERMADRRGVWAARRRLLEASPELRPLAARGFAEFEQSVARALGERMDVDLHHELYPALLASAATAAFRVACWYWQDEPTNDLTVLIGDVFDQLAAGLPAPAPHPSELQ